MTKKELMARRQHCLDNNLCFVSLKPFEEGDAAQLVMHEELGERVLVRPEYAKNVQKEKDNGPA